MKKKKINIHPKAKEKMSAVWNIKASATPFYEGKGLNLPALGYPCAACGEEQTKIRFAQSSDEEESQLLWMELSCKSCRQYSLYERK